MASKIFQLFGVILVLAVSAIATDPDDEDVFLDLILPQINETCMAECSQGAAVLHTNLSVKYPQHEVEIANFPVSPGFLADFCKVHDKEEQCRSTCGNLTSVDRLRQIVWSLPHLICVTEHPKLSAKHSCLLEAKKTANSTCVSACANQRFAPSYLMACRKYSCIYHCEKPAFDEKCGSDISVLVKQIRKHGWPTDCEDHF